MCGNHRDLYPTSHIYEDQTTGCTVVTLQADRASQGTVDIKLSHNDTVAESFLRSGRVGVVIPTYNASSHWYALQAGLDEQGVPPSDIVVIDSSSNDGTRSLAEKAGYQVVCIPKEEFNHGATRRLACDYLPDAEIVVFMTQDAVLARSDSIDRLCSSLMDPQIGAAYGRQLPRENADPIERHARLFNYPVNSQVKTFESRRELGFKAAFFSNSFAAYRRSALEEVGGFRSDAIVSEEVSVVAKMLLAGWGIQYKADALVIHSHPLSLTREFSRYFDIGVQHGREMWILSAFGNVRGDGLRYVKSEIKYLFECAPLWIPYSGLRIASKYVAYHLGIRERHLPKWIKRTLSGHPRFWEHQPQRPADVTTTATDGEHFEHGQSVMQRGARRVKGAAENP